MARVLVFAAYLLMAGSALAMPGAALQWNLAASTGYDDNLNNAPATADKIDSAIYSIDASSRWAAWRGAHTGLELSGLVQAQRVDAPSSLSSWSAAVQPQAWWVLGPGLYAPTLRLAVQGLVEDFDSELRDGHAYRASLSLAWRLSTRIHLQTQVQSQRHWAQAQEFAGRRESAGLGLMWRPGLHWKFFVLHDWQRGDIAVSVPSQGSQLSMTALPWVEDDALPGNWVYRLDTRSRLLSAGLDWQAGAHWFVRLEGRAIDNRAQRYAGQALGAYRRKQGRLSLRYAF